MTTKKKVREERDSNATKLDSESTRQEIKTDVPMKRRPHYIGRNGGGARYTPQYSK